MQLYRVKYLKCLRTGKYNLKHKSEINLSLVWLFLAIVIFYLNCFDSGPCTPVLSTGNIYSLFFCPWLLDKQSTFHWYKMALLYLEKKNIYIYIYIKSNIHICDKWWFFLCQWDLSEQTEKLVRMLLYTCENCSRKFHAWVHLYPVSKRRVKRLYRPIRKNAVKMPLK